MCVGLKVVEVEASGDFRQGETRVAYEGGAVGVGPKQSQALPAKLGSGTPT